MNWLLRALTSSVGKKYVMAVTGLMLCGFLVAHLAGNLLLIAGADAYNHYAHTLHENENLLHVAEVGLAAVFFAHLFVAFKVTAENRSARGRRQYNLRKAKGDGDGVGFQRPDTYMLRTGVLVGAYVVLHLIDFTLELRPGVSYSGLEPYGKAIVLLKSPISIFYAAGFVALFLHLLHGVMSAFQSLGICHPRYTPVIRIGSVLFAAGVSLGYLVVLIVALGQDVPAPAAGEGAEPESVQSVSMQQSGPVMERRC